MVSTENSSFSTLLWYAPLAFIIFCERRFNLVQAQTASSLLALAVGSLIIPTVFADWANGKTSGHVRQL